ncbi:hypothetical protein A4G99_12280 [Haladaptatus sp. R4]|uniref:hypothetical protein n=1 Tax=Haladaptatus sp. R4 TaxID=1679489 RepID=UPI0007B4C3B7|nr:hypothetical protein [Haladaptatus sp. R4]KZN23656.1 hypothetical protein A4G99_12280 [Haladaptatus sp. R4]
MFAIASNTLSRDAGDEVEDSVIVGMASIVFLGWFSALVYGNSGSQWFDVCSEFIDRDRPIVLKEVEQNLAVGALAEESE